VTSLRIRWLPLPFGGILRFSIATCIINLRSLAKFCLCRIYTVCEQPSGVGICRFTHSNSLFLYTKYTSSMMAQLLCSSVTSLHLVYWRLWWFVVMLIAYDVLFCVFFFIVALWWCWYVNCVLVCVLGILYHACSRYRILLCSCISATSVSSRTACWHFGMPRARMPVFAK